MNPGLTLTKPKTGVWVLDGDLTFAVLSHQYKPLAKAFPSSGPWEINAARLNHTDTSGIAFLLACVRHAGHQDIAIRLTHLPKKMITLMTVQGVFNLLEPHMDTSHEH